VLSEQARLLSVLDIESNDPKYQLETGPLEQTRSELRGFLPPKFVALHPFASDRSRCVPLNEWTQLAFALKGRGLSILWIGTPSELDELRRSFTHPHGYYADQLLDGGLAVSAAALSLASLFVGHDSGPLHIAGAFGVPVVGVFAPGQPDRTFPQGVGPKRMIARPTPAGINAGTLLGEIDALAILSLA
jgi:ADP-heptose:LPS heptosyltransferase